MESMKDDLHETLRDFDALPDSACVRKQVVARLFDVCSVTVGAWSKNGHIPAPRQVGRAIRWNVGELRQAIAGRARES